MAPEPVVTAFPAKLPEPLCPHCRQPLKSVGWLHNRDSGMVTLYHDLPACMIVLSVQVIPVQQEQPRLQLAPGYRPRGLG